MKKAFETGNNYQISQQKLTLYYLKVVTKKLNSRHRVWDLDDFICGWME